MSAHDWDGVRELISADARLTVADRFAGRMAETSYFANYGRLPLAWRLATGEVDGEPVIIIFGAGRGHLDAVLDDRHDRGWPACRTHRGLRALSMDHLDGRISNRRKTLLVCRCGGPLS